MKKYSKIIIICACSIFLMGCPSHEDESKEALKDSPGFTPEPGADEQIAVYDSGEDDDRAEVKESGDFDMDPVAIPGLCIGDKFYTFDFESNSSAEAFFEKIRKDSLTVDMHDYGGFEKVGDLPWELPTNDEEITAEPGDIILYQGNKLTIYYGENTWNFTRIGRIWDVDPEELREVLGDGDVTVEFSVEWTE